MFESHHYSIEQSYFTHDAPAILNTYHVIFRYGPLELVIHDKQKSGKCFVYTSA